MSNALHDIAGLHKHREAALREMKSRAELFRWAERPRCHKCHWPVDGVGYALCRFCAMRGTIK